MTLLGKDQAVILNAVIASRGRTYFLMVQRDATPSPLYGVPLSPHADIRFTVERKVTEVTTFDVSTDQLTADTVTYRADGGFDNLAEVQIGDKATLTLSQVALNQSVPGDGVYTVTVVTQDEDGYQIGAAWVVEVATRPPRVFVRTQRMNDNRTLALVYGDDDRVIEAVAEWEGGEYERRTWRGKRDAQTGARAFSFTLRPELERATFYLSDIAGNQGKLSVTLPPPLVTVDPAAEPPLPDYLLPFWLREADDG